MPWRAPVRKLRAWSATRRRQLPLARLGRRGRHDPHGAHAEEEGAVRPIQLLKRIVRLGDLRNRALQVLTKPGLRPLRSPVDDALPGPLNGHFGEDWTAEKRRYVGSKVVVRSAALLQLVTRLGAFTATMGSEL